jgi:hypothetical protein
MLQEIYSKTAIKYFDKKYFNKTAAIANSYVILYYSIPNNHLYFISLPDIVEGLGGKYSTIKQFKGPEQSF